MRKNLITALTVCGITTAALYQAEAAAQLRISDGTVAGTIVINDDGPGDSANTSPGVITYAGPVGANWFLNVTTGSGYPNLGSPSVPTLDLGTLNLSSAAGSLTIEFSEDGFTAGGPANITIGGNSVGTVTYKVWTDTNNVIFGKTTLVGTVGPLDATLTGGSFSGSAAGTVAPASPYSITMEATIEHPTGGKTGFDAALDITPPACNCSLAFVSPSSITNCAGDAIPAAVAYESCSPGQSNIVAVAVTGAVTNGVCPQIITRTNSATDDCGTVHTFVQTITVNCAPDCTITPSVTSVIVGTTNNHAFVADAGPGATYAWIVVNGTITAGQGTTNITWTAGNDTNNPISILITVTSGAGCQSSCSASVRATPKPPKINLGSGDTATIGFWHNKNGQAVILSASNSPALGNWLASNFPCMYGNLANQPNSTVAALFMTDFGVSGQKTYAQVLGGALAVYFTSSNLGANPTSAKFGFNKTPGGTGGKSFNVGTLGTVLGLQNNNSYTVMELLQAANANCPFNSNVFNALNTIFSNINQTGDIN